MNQSSIIKWEEVRKQQKKCDWVVGNTLDKLNQFYSYFEVLSQYNNRIKVEQQKRRPLVADTAARGIFFEEDTVDQYIHSAIPVINMKPTENVIQVLLPNEATIKSSHN